MEDFRTTDLVHDLNEKNLVDDEEMIGLCTFIVSCLFLVAPACVIIFISRYCFLVDLNEVPTKCVSFTGPITVEAQIQFIDFEGRSDGESIKTIIANMKPRRLILVRGCEESTRAIFSYAQQYTDAKIYAPKCGDLIDVTIETHIYQVRDGSG